MTKIPSKTWVITAELERGNKYDKTVELVITCDADSPLQAGVNEPAARIMDVLYPNRNVCRTTARLIDEGETTAPRQRGEPSQYAHVKKALISIDSGARAWAVFDADTLACLYGFKPYSNEKLATQAAREWIALNIGTSEVEITRPNIRKMVKS